MYSVFDAVDFALSMLPDAAALADRRQTDEVTMSVASQQLQTMESPRHILEDGSNAMALVNWEDNVNPFEIRLPAEGAVAGVKERPDTHQVMNGVVTDLVAKMAPNSITDEDRDQLEQQLQEVEEIDASFK